MGKIKQSFENVAARNGWVLYDHDTVIRLDARGDSGTWQAFAKIMEEEDKFLFYSLIATALNKDKIVEIALKLTEINYGLKLGNFEMDINNGEIHFKTYLYFTGECDMDDMIEKSIITNILTVDQFYKEIMASIYSK